MDLTTCLKSLLLAIQQYGDNRSAQNTAQLQKQVEVVLGQRCDRLLSSGQVLPSECVSGLVELAGDPNTNPALTGSIISLLAQFACDEESREVLHSSYNLTSTLASIIHYNSATPQDPLVLQCLQLLQKLTYNARIFHCSNYIHELIAFLMTNIQSHNDDITMPCLGLMANLCHNNQSVQSHIKALSNVKPFYRTLINFLAHNSLTVVVFALSLLASLTLGERVGDKLFDAKNIHQTFQLIFNIIVNGDGTLTRKYSVDLLIDLIRNPKISDYLTRYEHFSACVSQVLGLLHGRDPDSAAKVLELLLALCSVSGLRSLLCDVVFRPAGPRLRAAGRKQGAGLDLGKKAEPGLALVQWLTSSVEGAGPCCLQALQLLTELLEEALGAESVLGFVAMLVPVVLGLLKTPGTLTGDAQLRAYCLRSTHTTALLQVLCGEDSSRCVLASQLSPQLCLSHVEHLLSCCYSNGPLTSPDCDLSQVCAEAVLKTVEMMSKLRQQVKGMETNFYMILQDPRMVTPLSLAMTSNQRERVQTGLSLLIEATPLPDFPTLVLGESIAANNAYRQREAELSVKRVAVSDVPPPLGNSLSGPCPSSPSNQGIHNLIEKLQNSMELQEQVKDVRVSEIMDVYEQKLSALASKESRLQDLLQAKALALSQADRLISQYRCQRAQAEAEARKLASLLKEAERGREALQGEVASRTLEAGSAEADMREILRHNARLQADSQEHEALKGSYNQLLCRLEESERQLKELQGAHVALTKQSDALRRTHDALRLQHDKLASELHEREELISGLQSDLQKRDSDITGLQAELREQEERGSAREKEKKELEDTVDALRKDLHKMEMARKEASIRASSLEVQKGQVEAKLQKREDELNKNAAMIAMIHSLSGGKLTKDVNLSL
ncbi:protein CIP2A [Hypomesus transpacificus]|uniref:protein CIP2A n=1 Tax=Hypomesus transpacificus TaxID=137520 RepID=UPI001F07A5CA|nr:protein CIP2A [Hypomesus transpacificus]